MSDTFPNAPLGPRPAASAKLEPVRSAEPTGWRRLLPITVVRTSRGMRLNVKWRQALVSLVGLALVLWVGGAGVAYLVVKYRRKFDAVKFEHMLLYPLKKEEFRVARGDFMIEQAKLDLKRNKLREAFYGLQFGAPLSPGNRDGRLLLAQFYGLWQRPDLAENLLLEGLEANKTDKEYLHELFQFLLQRQEDQTLINVTDGLLRSHDRSAQSEEWVQLTAMARATALFFRGNYDAAEDALREYRLTNTQDGQILGLRIEWERGERETALVRLQAMTEDNPENEQVYSQYATFLRELGRDNELRRLCLLRLISFPDRPRARIDILYLYDKGGDEGNVQAGIEELFRDFPQNTEVLLALADFAANTGRPALARRIYDYCKANNLPWEGSALMTVEAYVVAKEYRESLDACRQMIKDNPEWGKRFNSVFNGLQAIANYGLKDVEAAQLFLNNFLDQPGVRAENLVAVSNRLLRVGANDQARQVLAQAVRADPLNQTALVGLIKLDLELGQADTITTSLRTLLTMRKPPRELLRDAYSKLASDHFIFAPGRAVLLEDMRATIDKRQASDSN